MCELAPVNRRRGGNVGGSRWGKRKEKLDGAVERAKVQYKKPARAEERRKKKSGGVREAILIII